MTNEKKEIGVNGSFSAEEQEHLNNIFLEEVKKINREDFEISKIKCLIEIGAEVDVSQGLAIREAVRCDNEELVKLLISASAVVAVNDFEAFKYALKNQNREILDRLTDAYFLQVKYATDLILKESKEFMSEDISLDTAKNIWKNFTGESIIPIKELENYAKTCRSVWKKVHEEKAENKKEK